MAYCIQSEPALPRPQPGQETDCCSILSPILWSFSTQLLKQNKHFLHLFCFIERNINWGILWWPMSDLGDCLFQKVRLSYSQYFLFSRGVPSWRLQVETCMSNPQMLATSSFSQPWAAIALVNIEDWRIWPGLTQVNHLAWTGCRTVYYNLTA